MYYFKNLYHISS